MIVSSHPQVFVRQEIVQPPANVTPPGGSVVGANSLIHSTPAVNSNGTPLAPPSKALKPNGTSFTHVASKTGGGPNAATGTHNRPTSARRMDKHETTNKIHEYLKNLGPSCCFSENPVMDCLKETLFIPCNVIGVGCGCLCGGAFCCAGTTTYLTTCCFRERYPDCAKCTENSEALCKLSGLSCKFLGIGCVTLGVNNPVCNLTMCVFKRCCFDEFEECEKGIFRRCFIPCCPRVAKEKNHCFVSIRDSIGMECLRYCTDSVYFTNKVNKYFLSQRGSQQMLGDKAKKLYEDAQKESSKMPAADLVAPPQTVKPKPQLITITRKG